MKEITFLGSSLEAIKDFPADARSEAGYQLRQIQRGGDPADWKPMKTVGQGVREIRIRDALGAFRVIYLATLADRVLVLHAFQKKTQQTAQHDIDLAAARLKAWRE
jgi:phage-related protein